MNVEWIKCNGGKWCGLLTVDLAHEHFDDLNGVYIIWSGKTVVRLGSGQIKYRLEEHRDNPDILAYPNLRVTWAKVHGNQMQGVEKYLSEQLAPAVGDRFPDSTPIPVNLPW